MKRLLVLLLLAGCSPSVTELQAKRDELEKTAIKLAYEAHMMEQWFEEDSAGMARIKAEVDRIRGDEYIDVCRDKKNAQLAKVVDQLRSVEKKLEKAILK